MSEAWVGGVPAPIVGIVGLPQSVTALASLGEKPICAFAAGFKSKPIHVLLLLRDVVSKKIGRKLISKKSERKN